MASADNPTEITQRFTVGGVLSDSFALVGRWPAEFVGLLVVIAVPQLALELAWDNWLHLIIQSMAEARAKPFSITGAATRTDALTIAGAGLVAAVSAGVADVWVRAAVAVAASDDLRGVAPDLRRCLRKVVSALPRLTIVGLLFGFGIGVPTAVASFLAEQGAIGQALMVWTLIGIVVLLGLTIIWWVQVPALMLEAVRPMASFGRSFVLMSGEGAAIFGLMLVISAPKLAIHWLLGFDLSKSDVLYRIADGGVDCTFDFVLAVVMAVSYHRLRAQKEGVVIGDIVQVFD